MISPFPFGSPPIYVHCKCTVSISLGGEEIFVHISTVENYKWPRNRISTMKNSSYSSFGFGKNQNANAQSKFHPNTNVFVNVRSSVYDSICIMMNEDLEDFLPLVVPDFFVELTLSYVW